MLGEHKQEDAVAPVSAFKEFEIVYLSRTAAAVLSVADSALSAGGVTAFLSSVCTYDFEFSVRI